MFALSACAAALVGCGGWYKPGASEMEFYQARSQCNMQAAAAYPVAMTNQGGYQAPARTNCTSTGGYGTVQTNCTTTPGAYTPGVQTDQNAIARVVAFQDCMRGSGWAWRTQ
jgi:hypothetical protein